MLTWTHVAHSSWQLKAAVQIILLLFCYMMQVRQFEGLLSPLLAPPLPSLPNAQMAWAMLAVEELCRHGISTFAVAPGMLRILLVSVLAPRVGIFFNTLLGWLL
jgi:hypothetical protein